METRNSHDFYIGLFLAMSSSVFIGSSFILKKKGLLKIQLRADLPYAKKAYPYFVNGGEYKISGSTVIKSAGYFIIICLLGYFALALSTSHFDCMAVIHICLSGQGGFGYLKEWIWWAGMILMAVGECANFTAYAFAPATLVTPLGALSVLVSAVLASRLLKEHLNLLGKIGCFIALLGSTIVVIHSPKEQDLDTVEELAAKLADPGFICYTVMVIISAVFLIFYCVPQWGLTNPLIYITITGIIGSLSVMGCKGLGVALKQTFAGDNQFTNWLTWFIIISLVCCISVQMNYLNKALDVYNTSVVTPILYVVFTTFVIIASAILFKEWGKLGPLDITGNICGFLIIVSGIFLLQGFKDMDISASNLPNVKRETVTLPTSIEPLSNGEISYSQLEDASSRLIQKMESHSFHSVSTEVMMQEGDGVRQ